MIRKCKRVYEKPKSLVGEEYKIYLNENLRKTETDFMNQRIFTWNCNEIFKKKVKINLISRIVTIFNLQPKSLKVCRTRQRIFLKK